MKSFTGKFSSVRGWALLLALLLGAGMMISACGDEEVPAPTTPAPPPAPPPAPAPEPEPEPEPTGPATPENLRVTATTSTSITWTWDAVEDVVGYEGQFSTDSAFTNVSSPFVIIAPATSQTVANLPGNTRGYFRVRSSAADLTFSEWTEGVSGTTDAPPAATALAAPGGLSAGNAQDDSITLNWNEVDDAESYEVEQRVDGAGGSWGDADCGGTGSNEVDGTSCVAEGLDEGTDYEFRVRGIPAGDDDAHVAGAWAQTDGTTTGRQQTTTSGGMGDLNVTWESDATGTITFSWQPMSGVDYEWEVLTAFNDDPDPCEDTVFTTAGQNGAQFSHPLAGLSAGDVRGLCVRVRDDDLNDDEKALSFAWGVSLPTAPTAGAATIEDAVAEALNWTAINVKDGFDWELRLVSDRGRGDGDLSGAPDDDVQAACDAGTFVDQGEADLDLAFNYTWDGSIDAFSGYTLCLRYANTAGSTEWAVPLDASNLDEIYTPPARPPSPSYQSSRSTTSPDGNTRTLVWTLNLRDLNNVPREATGFEAKTIHYEVRYDHDGDGATNMVSTPAPNSCVDGDITDGPSNLESGGTNPWTPTAAPDANDLVGISVTSTSFTIPANEAQNLGVRLCVRATQDSAGNALNGPWVLGGAVSIPKKSE